MKASISVNKGDVGSTILMCTNEELKLLNRGLHSMSAAQNYEDEVEGQKIHGLIEILQRIIGKDVASVKGVS